jgi:hypothetical protein
MSKNVAVQNTFDFENLPVPVPPDSNQLGRGSEGVTLSDMTIPRLEIIQSLSPQRKKNDPAYIAGAEEGLIFNTASHKLYGTKVYVVPVLWRKEYVTWRDRNKGGGFCGAFPTFDAAEQAVASRDDHADIEVLDTAQNFVLVCAADGSGAEEAVVSMSKSKMSASRQWNTLVRMAGGDRFSRVYRLETVLTKGAKGEYYNWKITQLGATPPALFERAVSMYESVAAGIRDVARDDA